MTTPIGNDFGTTTAMVLLASSTSLPFHISRPATTGSISAADPFGAYVVAVAGTATTTVIAMGGVGEAHIHKTHWIEGTDKDETKQPQCGFHPCVPRRSKTVLTSFILGKLK